MPGTQNSIPQQARAVYKEDSYYNLAEDFAPYLAHSYQPEVEQIFCELVRQYGPIRRLLDVGCASGGTSAFTKRHGVEQLVGVEIDQRAVELARHYLDDVVLADASSAELSYPDGHFDMLFFVDILEHLVDPWATLERYLRWLRPGGFVLVVLPNFGHVDLISSIVTGWLDYQQNGLMDSGHLRIFNHATGVKLIEGAGLSVEKVVYRLDGDWQRQMQGPIPLAAGAGQLLLDPNVVPAGLRRTLFARKLHFLARLPSA